MKKGDRVFVESYGWPRERYAFTVVTGNQKMMLWEGVGWDGRTKEPHLLVENDEGHRCWEPIRTLHVMKEER